MTIDWTDISSNNPIPDLGSYRSPLIGIKATEGMGYVWSQGDALADQARKRGIAVLRYHFARPGASGRAQADFFLAHCNSADIPCLDMEGSGWSGDEVQRVTTDFCREVESQRGPGVLYIGAYFTHIAWPKGWKWWVPAYTPTMPDSPAGYPKPWAWQYTDHGQISGMKAPGDVSHLLVPLGNKNGPAESYNLPAGVVWWVGHGERNVHEDPPPPGVPGVYRDGIELVFDTKDGWHRP